MVTIVVPVLKSIGEILSAFRYHPFIPFLSPSPVTVLVAGSEVVVLSNERR